MIPCCGAAKIGYLLGTYYVVISGRWTKKIARDDDMTLIFTVKPASKN